MMQEYQEAEAAKKAAQQGTGTGGQSATSPWENVNRWGDTISQAASKYGVPIDILYAIMMLESGGDPNAGSPQGATGLMQIMPFWNGTGGYDINDPNQNIMLGALILKQNFEQHGDWDTAIRAYLGFGVDALGTTDEAYLARVNQYRQQVTVTNTGAFGGGGGSVPPQGFSTLWGGGPPPGEINYVFGSPAAGPYYEYASAYGGDPNHHTGVDVPMPVGTPLYSLVSGTIVDSCTGSGFADYFGQGCGRITILTDSGDLIVYGHTSTSTVRSGQRVNPGMQLGTSGGENGPHLHLEVRVGGNHLVDPFAYFGA
jgi:murein DD-endopeptidase MepM/ murein hydrolase activator NlpD